MRYDIGSDRDLIDGDQRMPDFAYSDPTRMLLQARKDGDLNSLLEVYRSYVKLLARARIGKGLAGKFDASDIVQEVFLQACHAFEQFRGTTEAEFLAWLRQILAGTLANYVRHYYGTQKRDVRIEHSLQQRLTDESNVALRAIADRAASPSEHLAEKERGVILAEALDQLSEDYREVLTLHFIERIPFPEISQRMKRSLPSVKCMLPRALAQLRRQLRGKL
ncbi:MAG: sigma-70 family RNA polymerase sigma factor [Planctomycetales bacterium]|nr:sigma-70 family RNA polymerase sigma factor [Planctomycetales bacterium]